MARMTGLGWTEVPDMRRCFLFVVWGGGGLSHLRVA